ncbi:MAG TPA: serine protease, partial [Roseateles sp.]|nr:serine protease [Roseateles sp.]
ALIPLLAAALLALLGSAGAEPLPELVARAKPAVLLVGSFGLLDSPRFGFRGTGFAVGDGNHAVTNAHVLLPPDQSASGERRMAVQVYDGDRQWRQREATVVAVDATHDLALLRFDGPPLPPLRLAPNAALREGGEIALIGFPVGGALGFSHVTHRGILAARTAIALPAVGAQALNARAISQLRQGSFEVLQLDVTAYPGNSGGPVFDTGTGEVIGVVSMVLIKGTRESALSAPTGISYAMPVEHVQALLNRK